MAMAVMAAHAKDKGLDFTSHVAPDLPAVLVGDPHRLYQVLLNLISNAIKFTGAGSVAVEARLEVLSGDAARLMFAVRDTGTGISPQAQRKLFTAYTQGSIEVARKYGGTGVGLADLPPAGRNDGWGDRARKQRGQGQHVQLHGDFRHRSDDRSGEYREVRGSDDRRFRTCPCRLAALARPAGGGQCDQPPGRRNNPHPRRPHGREREQPASKRWRSWPGRPSTSC